MRPLTSRLGLAAPAWALAVLAIACAPADDSTSATARTGPLVRNPGVNTPQTVSLPDLSQSTAALAASIRGRYATMTSARENPAVSPIELGDAYGELGKLLMAARFNDAAETCYLNAQMLAPGDMRWPYYLAHLYRTKGALPKSAEYFEQALRLKADDVPTVVWLGDVYLAQGLAEAAEPLLAKALTLQPDSVAARFDLGRVALAKKDYAGAVRHLEAALALDRKAVIAHYPLAMAYRAIGDHAKAQAHLELRRRGDVDLPVVDPLMQELDELLQSPEAYDVRGIRALDREDWKTAAENFRQGIALAPRSAEMRQRLGTALFQLGDTPGAIEQFTEAVRVAPEYARAHYSLGVLKAAGGRDRDAIGDFAAAVKHEPGYVEARLKLAALLRRDGQFQQSLSHYELLSRSTPPVIEATFGHAMTLVGLRRYREATDRLIDGLKVHGDQPGLSHALARLLAASPDGRVRDGRRAMAVMQTLSDAERRMDLGETMAMIFAELGQYSEAATWQREAVSAATRAGRGDLANGMTENLRLYERQMPCRTPWRKSELP